MAGIQILGVHRTWEDWLGILLGVLIGLSPFLAGEQANSTVMWNVVLVGGLLVLLAGMEMTQLQRWEEVAQMLCGLWLIASPFTFGYAGAGTLATWHYALGGIVVLLALYELWQDWSLTEKQLEQHGQ